MQFSRTWKVLGKERLFKLAIEKFWIFVLEKYRSDDVIKIYF